MSYSFDEMIEFVRTSNQGGAFRASGFADSLPMGPALVLTRIVEGDRFSGDGPFRVGDGESRYDWCSKPSLEEFLATLEQRNYIRHEEDAYCVTDAARSATYDFLPLNGW